MAQVRTHCPPSPVTICDTNRRDSAPPPCDLISTSRTSLKSFTLIPPCQQNEQEYVRNELCTYPLTSTLVHSYHVPCGHIAAHGHPQNCGASRAKRQPHLKANDTPRICAAVRQTQSTRNGLISCYERHAGRGPNFLFPRFSTGARLINAV